MRRALTRYPRLRVHEVPRTKRNRRALRLGFASGVLAHLFSRRLPRMTVNELRKHEYPTSMQRLGVRFTDRVRDVFRFRWLRIH